MAQKQVSMITAQKGDRVKQFRTTVWDMLIADKEGKKNGWERIGDHVPTPPEAKKVSIEEKVPEKVTIYTPPEAVKPEAVTPLPEKVSAPKPKAKAKIKK